ncbi:hypothetical protein CAC42_2981 [Sphaceloma murrayae]|uniref:MIT domain-containing protein n=1 Tax=Sphaceloma murrayae TaxID=2082308 RepID=A0A2K1R0D1_9PEZI|nr:hypothetical protein CAC42_2981 [Sphaceloma murrayae]
MSTSAPSAHTSLSSSSVITVQRGSGQAPDSIHIRSASPAEGARIAARALKASAGQKPYRTSDANEPDDSLSVEGAGDERWSHSTASSAQGHRGRSSAGSRVGALEEREKPWRKSNNSPNSSPRPKHSSPGGSPSRYRQPNPKDRLGEYLPGHTDANRKNRGSGSSSRSNTPSLRAGSLPKLKLPPRDALARNYVSSPLSPAAMRPLTPGNTGLLTPSSATEPSDYFGLGIAVTKDQANRTTEASPRTPLGHSRYKKPPQNTESPTSEQKRQRESRGKDKREKDKKTMLSKALEKANTAVLLDNAQNFPMALAAYSDACRLLEHVMERTSGPDDKTKLDAIRHTYATRIAELTALQMPAGGAAEKQLPPRPTSNGSDDLAPQLDILSPVSPLVTPAELPGDVPRAHAQGSGRTRDSFLTDAIRQVEGGSDQGFLGPLWERSKSPAGLVQDGDRSRDDLNGPDAPPPLTPNRSQSPQPPPKDAPPQDAPKKDENGEPGSWLNTIDESDSDDASSVHSAKHGALRRKDLSNDKTNMSDFDTAFDEAVEAAYEEGYEPDHGDEEQQMMDDIAKDYMDQDFNFNLKSKSAVPRESASSAYTRSTWQSSVGGPDRTTAATSLSTLSEDSGTGGVVFPRSHHQAQASTSTVQTTESTVDIPASAFDATTSTGTSQILERRNRLSGQSFSLKPLTIETAPSPQRKRAPSTASRRTDYSQRDLDPTPWETQPKAAEVTPWEVQDKSAEITPWEVQAPSADFKPARMGSLRKHSDKEVWTPNPSSAVSDSGSSIVGDISSPKARYLRSQKSSLSLRETALGAMTPTEGEPAPTPTSATFSQHYTRRNDSTSHLSQRSGTVASSSVPPLPDAGQQGGYYLFDTTLGRSIEQGLSSSPRTSKETVPPTPFEPCPDSALLRPFWLLRLIANTTTHPRGAYITTRLFMPHEAWMNRSAKLKNLEDKISACDLLTAALARLGEVDTYDADAVLAELQQFEETMERVQVMLIKKLGNEVGVNASGALFKDADKNADSPPDGIKDSKSTGKFSWRKFRGKNSVSSSAGLTNPVKGATVESTTMPTVPMTSFSGVEKRTAHRREALRDAVFEGPHKDYMAAIAKLCEAAQVLDQVARQVEDPGLKHSSSTHIGLEFSTRHAAEFFGFYICRFLLADIGTLIDKHVKRSTEWILA